MKSICKKNTRWAEKVIRYHMIYAVQVGQIFLCPYARQGLDIAAKDKSYKKDEIMKYYFERSSKTNA